MDSNVCSLDTAPPCVADVFRRPCEAEGIHTSRSKRRKLRDRRVAVRKALCNTMDFKSRVTFIPASIGHAPGVDTVLPVLLPLLQKLEVIEGMLSQFISCTSSLHAQSLASCTSGVATQSDNAVGGTMGTVEQRVCNLETILTCQHVGFKPWSDLEEYIHCEAELGAASVPWWCAIPAHELARQCNAARIIQRVWKLCKPKTVPRLGLTTGGIGSVVITLSYVCAGIADLRRTR
jgi:hypothetical protein